MTILITGASGFIGTHMRKKLVDEGYTVFGLDIENPKEQIEDKFYQMDLIDARMEDVFKETDVDVVLHMGAQAYIVSGEAKPVLNAIDNVAGTVNVLENARKVGAAVVFTSSGAVYGNVVRIPVHEEVICRPESQYGISKLVAEEYAKFYYYKRDLPVTITRFSSVYGPGRKAGPINLICEQALKGDPVIIYGDGRVTRDLTYVSDVVEGLKRCIDGTIPCGDIYNIASGVQISVMDIVKTIEKVMGRDLQIEYKPEVPGDIKINYFDISKAQRYGYTPKVSLEEGIRKVIEYLEGGRTGGEK